MGHETDIENLDAAGDHLFLRILSHLEYPEEYDAARTVLAEHGLMISQDDSTPTDT